MPALPTGDAHEEHYAYGDVPQTEFDLDRENRRCTDLPCFFLTLVAAALAVAFSHFTTGDELELVSFTMMDPTVHVLLDSYGTFCGFGSSSQLPYLYICPQELQSALAADKTGDLPLIALEQKRICVAACPQGNTTPPLCGEGSDYASVPRLGEHRVCTPTDVDLNAIAKKLVADMQTAAELINLGWPKVYITLICLMVAVILEGMYLRCLRAQFDGLLWILVLCASLFFGGMGSTLLDHAKTAHQYTTAVATLLLAAATVVIFLYIRCAGEKLQLSFKCMHSSTECLEELGSLRCVGVICGFVRGLLVLPELISFVVMTATAGEDLQGSRLWKHFFIYGLLYAWLNAFLFSVEAFVITYLTQEWYQKKIVPDTGFFTLFQNLFHEPEKPVLARTACQGLWLALRYHIGTLLLYSFVVVITRLLQIVLALPVLVKYMQCPNDGCGCLEEWSRITSTVTKCYMDVVMRGSGFIEAARYTEYLLTDVKHARRVLTGTVWAFHFLGVLGISGVSASIAWLIVIFMQNVMDTHKFSTITVAQTSFACALVISPMLGVLNITSDNILFCFAQTESLQAAARGDTGRDRRTCDCELPGFFSGGARPKEQEQRSLAKVNIVERPTAYPVTVKLLKGALMPNPGALARS